MSYDKTTADLLRENNELRRRVAALEKAGSELADAAQISVNIENQNRKDLAAWIGWRDYDSTKGRMDAAIAFRLLANVIAQPRGPNKDNL